MTAFRFAPALLLLASAFGLAQQPAAPPAPPFATQVKDGFAKWDRNGDGTLSREEIDAAVIDPKVKGAEAAAVVALKRAVRNSKLMLPPLTLKTLDELAKGPGAKDKPDFNGMYDSALTRITKANRELFAKGAPSIEDLHQGKLGDCFCLAPLGSMVCRDPQDVVKMIRPQKDGSYLVKFGPKEIKIAAPTDAEIALTANGGADGLWVNVYEKAVAAYRLEQAGAAAPQITSGIDLLAKGGSAGTMVGVVTGHKIERFSCAFAKDEKVKGEERDAKLKDMRKQLTAAFAAKKLVTCGTASGVTTPGINGNHAYAVTGYDPKTDEIALWNPHGNTFTPKGAAGLANGYPVKNGRFKVPLTEFVRIFAGLAFETDAPNE